MKIKYSKILALLFFVTMLCLQSCATLFTGTKETITFNSKPEGAKIQVNGIDKGTTPCTIVLKKNLQSPIITLQKNGYQARQFQLEQSFNIVSVLNFTNFLGWGIDLATGALKNYDTKFYDIQLDKTTEVP